MSADVTQDIDVVMNAVAAVYVAEFDNFYKKDAAGAAALAVAATNFVNKFGASAQQAAAGSTIFPQTVLSAAGLESGFGKSSLAAKYNNYFGIKADPSWKGRSVVLTTGEQTKAGVKYNIQAKFRIYETPTAAFKDYVKFIQGPRYLRAGVTTAKTPELQMDCIQKAGYATDISYAAKLKRVLLSVLDWGKIAAPAAVGIGAVFFFL